MMNERFDLRGRVAVVTGGGRTRSTTGSMPTARRAGNPGLIHGD